MNAIISFVLVVVLFLLGWIGGKVSGLHYLVGVIFPYLAFAAFLIGVIWRVVKWAKAPVPFRIPTTAGQGKSLPWIKHSTFDNPASTWGVIGRMAAEIFLFRSLFRNTKVELLKDQKVAYGPEKLLWLTGLAFHYTFLIILIRHLRFFTEPIPGFVNLIQSLDGFFQLMAPTFFLSSVIFLGAVTVLFLRRVLIPQVRYISLAADYFPLFLIMAIGITGVLLRYFIKVDVTAVKKLTMGLASFQPTVPAEIGSMFYVHIFLVCILFAYFPFSKLLHMAGVFMSPTRNLANSNRVARHINPWDYPVETHTYEEYEDDFREKLVKMGIPVDKPLEKKD